jgi:hypothetical protein
VFVLQARAFAESHQHHAPLLRTSNAREMLGEGVCFHYLFFESWCSMVQRAQMKLWARGEGEIPKCPLCREEFPDQDGDTQEMLDLVSPGASQETEDSPSPDAGADAAAAGALTLSLSCKFCAESCLVGVGISITAQNTLWDAAAADVAATSTFTLSLSLCSTLFLILCAV